ncbi:DNA polymerase III subunit psi [Vibrio profundum]|uniref:DNA polymerase III subunit psi n=1 Tax=Vibrio profundum TaxID=2910247 RepID=UPI003D0FE6B3
MSQITPNLHHQQFLTEMGITSWQLMHPDRLEKGSTEALLLPLDCQLLFVSSEPPYGALATMFGKILKSFHLELSQARHILPEHLSYLSQHQLEWIWFAGCDVQHDTKLKVLSSPTLSKIEGNPQLKRQLWQQICAYESK